MSDVNKNKAVIDYLITCPQIYQSPLYFNFINADDGTMQIMTSANDYYTSRPYIDGSISKLYTFTLIIFKSASDMPIVKLSGYDSENVDDLADVQALIDWIKEQNDLQNFPDFGEECEIDTIRPTRDAPYLMGINTDLTPPLAMYSVTIQIEYVDNTKKIWN